MTTEELDTMTEELNIFNHNWKPGWQLDLEYRLPRIVFHAVKNNSTCYMYELKDFKEHLRTCELTNLEYLEGISLYEENLLLLQKKEINNHA
jgi:hypothetical protein